MLFSQLEGVQSSYGLPDDSDYLADAGFSELLDAFGKLEDPRGRNGRRYGMSFVLGVCCVAVLAGARRYSEIGRRARGMSQRLLAALGAEWNWFKQRYVAPSISTIRRVLCSIDAWILDKIVGEWLAVHAPKSDDGDLWIAVDGKVLRGSWTDENDQVTLFSALIHCDEITIAQVRVPDGTNEITQVSALLDALPIPSHMPAMFTLDSAHTQRETAKEIRKVPGWHYLMEVKGNQPKLQRAVFDKLLPFFRKPPHDIMEDDARGMLKRWSCWITDADGVDFPGAGQVGAIWREAFNRSGERLSKEIVLIITSRKPGELTAAVMNRGKRDHWRIENGSHYVRDTVFQEDLGQEWVGAGPQSLAGMRNLAIGLIHLKGHRGIKETTEWVAEDRDRAAYFMAT